MTDHNMSMMSANGAADEAAIKDWAELLVARARSEGVELTGEDWLVDGSGPPDVADGLGGRDGRASRL